MIHIEHSADIKLRLVETDTYSPESSFFSGFTPPAPPVTTRIPIVAEDSVEVCEMICFAWFGAIDLKLKPLVLGTLGG